MFQRESRGCEEQQGTSLERHLCVSHFEWAGTKISTTEYRLLEKVKGCVSTLGIFQWHFRIYHNCIHTPEQKLILIMSVFSMPTLSWHIGSPEKLFVEGINEAVRKLLPCKQFEIVCNSNMVNITMHKPVTNYKKIPFYLQKPPCGRAQTFLTQFISFQNM